jgi:hypothetical protein
VNDRNGPRAAIRGLRIKWLSSDQKLPLKTRYDRLYRLLSLDGQAGPDLPHVGINRQGLSNRGGDAEDFFEWESDFRAHPVRLTLY